jgi:hypothetical protein
MTASPDPPLWSILIATLSSRRDRLAALLGVLLPQCEADGRVEVVGCWDNGEATLPAKRQALLGAAQGTYVSYADDDDMVEPDFVAAVTAVMTPDPAGPPAAYTVLTDGPDYVAFEHAYYVDGIRQPVRVLTGIGYHGWYTDGDPVTGVQHLVRDVTHINPVRRSLTGTVSFTRRDGVGLEDWSYVSAVRPRLRTQADLGRVLYHYQHRPHDSAQRALAPHTGLPRLDVTSPCFRWVGA